MCFDKALVDEFCSERTVHMEAQTHHRHPYSPTTSNSAISLYTLIYALARETHGERTLDSWVKNNLDPAMRGVSYVLQSRYACLPLGSKSSGTDASFLPKRCPHLVL